MLLRLACAALIVSQFACTVDKVLNEPPGAYIAAHNPEKMWVKLDGTETLLLGPKLISDTVFAFTTAGQNTLVPVEKLGQVRVKTISAQRSILLGVGVAALAGAFVATKSRTDNDPKCSPRTPCVCDTSRACEPGTGGPAGTGGRFTPFKASIKF